MKCRIDGCPGEYEARKIFHAVRHKGHIILIDHVPAEVCTECADTLLKPDTVRSIEALLRQAPAPTRAPRHRRRHAEATCQVDPSR